MAYQWTKTDAAAPERVLLIGLDCGDYDAEASMAELERLTDTAGGLVVGHTVQKRPAPEGATYIGSGLVESLAAHRVGDAGGASAFEGDARSERAGMDAEVGTRFRRIEVGDGGGTARALALRDLVEADAGLCGAIEVRVARHARLHAGFDEGLRQRIGVAQVGNGQGAIAAVQ